MPNQPTSFRYPFALPADVHPGVRNALRLTYNGVKDLNDAIRKLNTKVNANTSNITNITQNVTSSSGGSPAPPSPIFGAVNLQPNLTPGAYTLAQSDLGGLILVQSGIAFALTLNSGLVTPFFTTVYNLGAGTITATPSLGNVNNVASVTLTTNQFGIFYFDGTNWWDVFPVAPAASSVALTVTSPQALALKAAPQQILAAPGAGFMYRANSISYQYKFVTTPYTVNASGNQYLCVYAGTQPTLATLGKSFSYLSSTGFMDQASSQVFDAPGLARAAQSEFENKALNIALPSDATAELLAGAGTLTITVEYATVALV